MANNNSRKAPSVPVKEDPNDKYVFPLGRINFIIMALSALLIVIGFVLISGGAPVGNEFNPEVFSATRIVVGPTIVLIGFVGIGVGIMWPRRRKENNVETEEQK